MPAPPLKTEISDTYPNPSNAVARVGFGKLWETLFGASGLLGSTGNASDARTALGVPAANNSALTGNPTATTQAATDDSTRIATTAWVRLAMTNIASAAGFVLSTTVPGYIKLPSWLGGFIIQWGSATTGLSGVTVSFPITFPTALFAVVATPGSSSGVFVTTQSLSTSSFYLQGWISNAAQASTGVSWVAIGK